VDLKYPHIEQQLTEALPEVRAAAEHYWKEEGAPGQDAGPYIFFESMFACYLEILLAMPASKMRAQLLGRAFGFVDEMFSSSDREVQNLVFIGLYQGRPSWWLHRASEFIGPQAEIELDRFYPEWRQLRLNGSHANTGEFTDLHGVRQVIARELAVEGVNLEDIPGTTHTTEVP